jgi:hypothetical protein
MEVETGENGRMRVTEKQRDTRWCPMDAVEGVESKEGAEILVGRRE